MSRSRWVALPLFAAWTLLVWGTRIDNIWSDAALDTTGKVGRTLLALSFVVAALAVGAVAFRVWRRTAGAIDRRTVHAAAIWTVAVWVVRSVGIAAADHDLPFTVVHLVLAVVSTALAVLAWRAVAVVTSSGQPPAHVVSR